MNNTEINATDKIEHFFKSRNHGLHSFVLCSCCDTLQTPLLTIVFCIFQFPFPSLCCVLLTHELENPALIICPLISLE